MFPGFGATGGAPAIPCRRPSRPARLRFATAGYEPNRSAGDEREALTQMRSRPKPGLVDIVLSLLGLAGILGLALGSARVQTAGVIAIVLAAGVGLAIRPRPGGARVTSRGG